MLQKIKLRCSYNGDATASYHWGTLTHGALMEILPAEISEMLHENSLRPFSQYVLPREGNMLDWNIGVWDDEVAEAIIKAVLPLSGIELKHKGVKLEILGSEQSRISEKDFLSGFFTAGDPCRRYVLEFLTPSTHKSAGEYVIFPTPELIIQNLCMRLNTFSQDFSADDPETMAEIASNVKIKSYSLRSARFSLQGTYIPGYLGRITLSLYGPVQLVRLTGMILSFAEYAGVGIKTSLGMGGCRVTPVPGNRKNAGETDGD